MVYGAYVLLYNIANFLCHSRLKPYKPAAILICSLPAYAVAYPRIISFNVRPCDLNTTVLQYSLPATRNSAYELAYSVLAAFGVVHAVYIKDGHLPLYSGLRLIANELVVVLTLFLPTAFCLWTISLPIKAVYLIIGCSELISLVVQYCLLLLTFCDQDNHVFVSGARGLLELIEKASEAARYLSHLPVIEIPQPNSKTKTTADTRSCDDPHATEKELDGLGPTALDRTRATLTQSLQNPLISSDQQPPDSLPYTEISSDQQPPDSLSNTKISSDQKPPDSLPYTEISSDQQPPDSLSNTKISSDQQPPDSLSYTEISSDQRSRDSLPDTKISSAQQPPDSLLNTEEISSLTPGVSVPCDDERVPVEARHPADPTQLAETVDENSLDETKPEGESEFVVLGTPDSRSPNGGHRKHPQLTCAAGGKYRRARIGKSGSPLPVSDDAIDVLDGNHIPESQRTASQPTVKAGFLLYVPDVPSESELDRLSSYTGFHSDHMIAADLAYAGFISWRSQSVDEVVCAWCRLSLSDFKERLNPLALHRAYSQDSCGFLQRNTDYNQPLNGYIPSIHSTPDVFDCDYPAGKKMASLLSVSDKALMPEPSLHEKDIIKHYEYFSQPRFCRPQSTLTALNAAKSAVHESAGMRSEQKRLESFTLHSSKPPAQLSHQLAADGFYLQPDSAGELSVVCAFCDVRILYDAVKTESSERHHTLDCGFALGDLVSNIPKITESRQGYNPAELSRLGVQTSGVKHSKLAQPNSRLETFLTCDHSDWANPKELATNGFFFEGRNTVTCFCCGVSTGNWVGGESAAERHARISPDCQFLIQQHGLSFISETRQRLGPYEYAPTQSEQTITTRQIRPRYDSPVVQAALDDPDINLTRQEAVDIIKRRLQRGGADITSVTELIHERTSTVEPLVAIEPPPLQLPRLIQTPEVTRPSLQPEAEPAPSSPEPIVATHITRERALQPGEVIESLTCKVCLVEPVAAIFLQCGHMVCCLGCSMSLDCCPICRSEITGRIRVYL